MPVIIAVANGNLRFPKYKRELRSNREDESILEIFDFHSPTTNELLRSSFLVSRA